MNLMRKYFTTFLLLSILLMACNSTKKQAQDIQIEFGQKPTIVYKTTGDYYQNVPVTLSADKSQIVAYPSPRDVYYNGNLAYPTRLSDGFLLDNRGINENTAFLKMTYEEYSKLEKVPSLEALKEMIIDKNPITVCYNCGNIREKDQLNILIQGKALSKCKQMVGN